LDRLSALKVAAKIDPEQVKRLIRTVRGFAGLGSSLDEALDLASSVGTAAAELVHKIDFSLVEVDASSSGSISGAGLGSSAGGDAYGGGGGHGYYGGMETITYSDAVQGPVYGTVYMAPVVVSETRIDPNTPPPSPAPTASNAPNNGPVANPYFEQGTGRYIPFGAYILTGPAAQAHANSYVDNMVDYLSTRFNGQE
jgi:hypothetical protein